MPASIRVLQISRHDLPLLILTVEQNRVVEHWTEVFAVWPSAPEDGAEVASIVRLGIKANRSDPDDTRDAVEVRDLAVYEAIMHFAAKEASKCAHPLDSFMLEEVDHKRLRAWRSLGFFQGLSDYDVLKASPILQLLNGLPDPIYFER